MAISVLLLIATAGITVSKHYCGDKLEAVALINSPDACCDMESCCHDETQVFMLDNDFTYTPEEPVNIPGFKTLEVPGYSIAASLPVNSPFIVFNDRPQPPGLRTYLASIQSFLL
ncbi:MAG: HYC_CC_PP family protein [Bacteroidales bacterium]